MILFHRSNDFKKFIKNETTHSKLSSHEKFRKIHEDKWHYIMLTNNSSDPLIQPIADLLNASALSEFSFPLNTSSKSIRVYVLFMFQESRIVYVPQVCYKSTHQEE